MTANPGNSDSPCVEEMLGVLWNAAPASAAAALAPRLDRRQLNFTLASLREVDRYLTAVQAWSAQGAGWPLLATLWAVALYVGEIIRREAPAGRYEWFTVGETRPVPAATSTASPDIAVVWALRSREGEVFLPSRAVLRVALRGLKARSIESFARAAIGLTGDAAPPVSMMSVSTSTSRRMTFADAAPNCSP
jgi:hypothetical protein